jgi:hypothetical protein
VSESNKPAHAAEKRLAAAVFVKLAKRVTESIGPFGGWMLAAYAGAFSFVLSKYPEVSTFVDAPHIRDALMWLLAAFVLALPSRLMIAQVTSGLAVTEDMPALVAQHEPYDRTIWAREYLSGLILPNRLIAGCVMRKVQSGDIAAGARLIAKLSQWQAVTVWVQILCGIIATGCLVFGLKA